VSLKIAPSLPSLTEKFRKYSEAIDNLFKSVLVAAIARLDIFPKTVTGIGLNAIVHDTIKKSR
jgi:hypothetical protein